MENESSHQATARDFVRARFPDEVTGEGSHAGQMWIEVRRDRIVDILTAVRDELQFEMLMDLTAVDWLNQGTSERFSIVYELYSLTHSAYFRLKAWVPESDPEIDSIHGVWKAAPFAEREVWDMYGIRFRGLADHKRILLPEAYVGHPLRKDYPLIGQGERYDFPKHTR